MPESMSMNRAATTQPGGFADPLFDHFMDLSGYDNLLHQSSHLSPAAPIKQSLNLQTKAETAPPSLLPSNQQFTAPSHQYDLYKQQTGIVPGALETTFAVNQINSHISGFSNLSALDYTGMMSPDQLFASQAESSTTTASEDFMLGSPMGSALGYETIDPSAIGGQEPTALPSPPAQTGNVGRAWPGMHQQAAAMAKSQQVKQMTPQRQQPKQPRKSKSPQPADPLVEHKISQVLNSMRAMPTPVEPVVAPSQNTMARLKKELSEMDPDEKLLASEEGKKMDSKSRRQLRNKVSARAFRSRRKEYISHLEHELAAKINDNSILRSKVDAMATENKRLTDLTRMLLSSPAFSDFLTRLSEEQAQPHQQMQLPQVPAQHMPQHEQRQLPKDINPYAAQQQLQQPQSQTSPALAAIPEDTFDYSAFLEQPAVSDGFSYQPQVYTAEIEPLPLPLDAAVFSGKTTTFVGPCFDEDEPEECKADIPVIDRPAPTVMEPEPIKKNPVDEEFEADPAFALYHDSPAPSTSSVPSEPTTPQCLEDMAAALSQVLVSGGAELFAGIESEKSAPAPMFELVDKEEVEMKEEMAVVRVQRLTANLEAVAERLEMLL